jgi:hypothetical protein
MVLSLAPAPPEPPPAAPAPIPAGQVATLTALLKARQQAAQKVFDQAWSYYKQARSDALPVYVWSEYLLHAQVEMSNNPAERIAALETHHQHMTDLEALVIKVRRLGLGKQIEVGETGYFRIDAAYRLAQARAREGPSADSANQAATLTALLKTRSQAAQKQFDQAWSNYKQARSSAYPVYTWSQLFLHAQMAITDDPAEQIAAREAHHQRMTDLETLVIKVRRLGFAQQIEVWATEYFRLEAEYTLARARAAADAPVPRPELVARAARKQFDQAWSSYKQKRSDAFFACVWSRFLLTAQMAMTDDDDQAGRIAALEAHHQRIKDLETLVNKVRRLGFGQQIEVGQTEYFRLDAEYLLAQARDTLLASSSGAIGS